MDVESALVSHDAVLLHLSACLQCRKLEGAYRDLTTTSGKGLPKTLKSQAFFLVLLRLNVMFNNLHTRPRTLLLANEP